jgi:hypothetical protein
MPASHDSCHRFSVEASYTLHSIAYRELASMVSKISAAYFPAMSLQCGPFYRRELGPSLHPRAMTSSSSSLLSKLSSQNIIPPRCMSRT